MATAAVESPKKTGGFKSYKGGDDRRRGPRENARGPLPSFVAEFNEKVKAEESKIDELKEQMKTLQAQIAKRNDGKEEYQKKRDAIRQEIDKYLAQIDTLEKERKAIQDHMDNKRNENNRVRSQAKDIRKKAGLTSEADISSRIKDIEIQLDTTTMPLVEERKLLDEIKKLRKLRPALAKVSQLEASKQQAPQEDMSKERLDAIMDNIKRTRDLRTVQQQAMSKLYEERKDKTADLQELMDKKKQLGDKVQECIERKNQLREEKNAKLSELNAQRESERAAAEERIKAEKARQAEQREKHQLQQELDNTEDQPLRHEIAKHDRLIEYCQELANPDARTKKNEENEKETAQPNASEHPENVILSKKDTGGMWNGPSASKKKTKSNKKDAEKKLKHEYKTVSLFQTLGAKAPSSVDEIPATIKSIEELKQKVIQRQEEMVKDRVARREELLQKLEELKKRDKEREASEAKTKTEPPADE